MHERISRATATAGARERRAGGGSVSFRSKGDRARVEGVDGAPSVVLRPCNSVKHIFIIISIIGIDWVTCHCVSGWIHVHDHQAEVSVKGLCSPGRSCTSLQ